MNPSRIDWTPTRRREHARVTAEGKRRAAARRKLLIAHVDDFRSKGQAHQSLAPIIAESEISARTSAYKYSSSPRDQDPRPACRVPIEFKAA